MNATGWWTLHFDWGLKGSYHSNQIYFNFDGTFGNLAGANEGTWTEIDGAIIWRYKRTQSEENNTIYSGSINRNFMSGIMFSESGERGQWYAIKKGAKIIRTPGNESLPYIVDKNINAKMDYAGRPQ